MRGDYDWANQTDYGYERSNHAAGFGNFILIIIVLTAVLLALILR